MIDLEEVRISDADTCITYALRRIGYTYDSDDVVDYQFLIQQIHEGFFTKEKVDDGRQIGDILMLELKPVLLDIPNVISVEGLIQTNTVPTSRAYCMVFETRDLVSGVFKKGIVYKDDIYYKGHPAIAIMGYDGFSKEFITGLCGTQPPYILRRVR